MRILKNKILSVLLFVFAFFIMHDYFVQDQYEGAKCEIYQLEHDESFEDAQSHMHEAVHSIWATNCEEKLFLEEKLPDTKPNNTLFTLSTYVNLVPQRPPLS